MPTLDIDHRRRCMLAALRILIGAILIAVWAENLTKGYYSPDGYADFLRSCTDGAGLGFYKAFSDGVVIPNAAFFGYLQLILEIVVMGVPDGDRHHPGGRHRSSGANLGRRRAAGEAPAALQAADLLTGCV